nr:MAG: putative capsid protein [Ips partiti-like virus 1]
MESEKKMYTSEEIQKIAPGYKGKPENFNPAKGKKRPVPKPKGERKSTLPPPTNTNAPPTPQRNESIISEAIFGIDVTVTEIAPRQVFSANYAKLVELAAETYDAMRVDEKQIDRMIAREEVAYYSTALLQMKLIETKAKQGDCNLTSAEKDIRKATSDDVFNVPQTIFTYLKEIGTYTDKMGKETGLEVPPLPTTVVQNFGGYHAAEINADTHSLFEEIPSLGIAGDMVMALASDDAEPVPNFHIRKPQGTVWTNNLVGRFHPIGPRRPEIKQRLAGFGITVNHFTEYIPGTRFNLRYLRSLSDILGKMETFRTEKVTIKNLSLAGGETQVVKTQPVDINEPGSWKERSVQALSSATSSTATMGAANVFGFQLYKEDGPGETRTARVANWSCIVGPEWNMSDDWYNGRNARRNLPDGIGTSRFRAISLRQDIIMSNVVRRMIKTPR